MQALSEAKPLHFLDESLSVWKSHCPLHLIHPLFYGWLLPFNFEVIGMKIPSQNVSVDFSLTTVFSITPHYISWTCQPQELVEILTQNSFWSQREKSEAAPLSCEALAKTNENCHCRSDGWPVRGTRSCTDRFSFSAGHSEPGHQRRKQKDWLPYKANLPEPAF